MNLGSLIPRLDRSNVPVRRTEMDPADPFTSFRRDVERMFDDFFDARGSRGFGPMAAWQGPAPVIDVDETDKELIVTAELPGLDEKDFEVSLAGDTLTIKGEKKSEHEEHGGRGYYAERRFGAFTRSVRLPFEAGNEAVDARYQKGVLKIRVPKPAEAQRAVRRIDVKAG